MELQKNKVEYIDSKGKLQKVFFFDHSFKTAFQHAKEFISRNKDKIGNPRLFDRNVRPFGPTWLLNHQV